MLSSAEVREREQQSVHWQARSLSGYIASFARWLFWPLLLGLGFLLRLVGAESRSIWSDEALTLYQIRLSFPEILANKIPLQDIITTNTNPPLYNLFLGVWGRLVGFEIWPLRVFSVFCILITVALLYRVGSWMAGREAGRFAALLGAISPLYLWYGQELRMYALLMVPAALSFGLLWKWYRRWEHGKQAWFWVIAYAITAGAMIWTHYTAFLLVGAQMLWVAGTMLRRRPVLLFGAGAGVLLIALPLLPFVMKRLFSGGERNFFFVRLPVITLDLFNSFSFGPTSVPQEVLYLYPLVLVLLLMGLWQARRSGGWSLVLLLSLSLVLPVLMLYCLTYIKPMYQGVRHLMVISPAFYLLVGLGIARVSGIRGWLPLLVVPFLAYGWMFSAYHYFHDPAFQKDDLVGLYEYISEHFVPGDIVVLNDPVQQHAISYLAPDLPWIVLPKYTEPEPEKAIPLFEETARKYERVWYVYGPGDSVFYTAGMVYDWFKTHHSLMRDVSFHGLTTTLGVAYFDTQHATRREPHPAARPADAHFRGGLHFLGLGKEPGPFAAGQQMVLETLWTVDHKPKEDYQMMVQFLEPSGRLRYQQHVSNFSATAPTSWWQVGEYIRRPLFLRVPVTFPPGNYEMRLAPVTPGGKSLFPEGQDQPLSLGTITITRPKPDPKRSGLEGPVAGNSLRLAARTLPDKLSPGEPLTVRLLAQVESPNGLPDRLEVRLKPLAGQARWAKVIPLADGAPTFPPAGWQPGDRFELRYDVTLPGDIEGAYRVELAALRGEERVAFHRWWGLVQEETLPLGSVEVEARDRRYEVPELNHEIGATWSGHVRLLGYKQQPASIAAGQGAEFQLVWQAMKATKEPYKVFLHVVDDAGNLVLPIDAGFDVPSTAWGKEEIVISHHQLQTGQLPPGRYTLLAGLYPESGGERLPVDAPNAALPIGTLEVAP